MFSEKLKRTKRAMVSLNLSVGNLSTVVKLAKEDLHHVQTLLHSNTIDPILIEQEKKCIHHLWAAIDREETLLHQKSRATWLSVGDRNSPFFSNMMKSRWNSNKIYSILNADGDMVNGQEAVESVAVDYFKIMFNSSLDSPYSGLEDYGPCLKIWLTLPKPTCFLLLFLIWKSSKFSHP